MDHQTMINFAAGTALSALGWFAKQMWDAVQKLRQDLHQIEVELPKGYVAKDEFAEAMREIRDGLKRIYDKLDGKADK